MIHVGDTILIALCLAIGLAAVVVLLRKYFRTREVALAWLSAYLFIWPLVSWLLTAGARLLIDRAATGHLVGVYPFTLIQHGQVTVGGVITTFHLLQSLMGTLLLLIAVLSLSKMLNRRDQRVTT